MNELPEVSKHLDQGPILQKQVEEILAHVREQRNHALILGGVAFLSLQILGGLTEKEHESAIVATLNIVAGRTQLILAPAADASQGAWKMFLIAGTESAAFLLGVWIFWSAIKLYGRPIAVGKQMPLTRGGRIQRGLYLKEVDDRLTKLYQGLNERKEFIHKIEVRLMWQFWMMGINLFLVQWL
jgi:hypothetical protein